MLVLQFYMLSGVKHLNAYLSLKYQQNVMSQYIQRHLQLFSRACAYDIDSVSAMLTQTVTSECLTDFATEGNHKMN